MHTQVSNTRAMWWRIEHDCDCDDDLSEMSVANAASLARMLQDRADPSLLFLRDLLAIILQILRTIQTHTVMVLLGCFQHELVCDVIRMNTLAHPVHSSVCPHRSAGLWEPCVRCPVESSRSVTPDTLDPARDSDRSNPPPAATD